MLLRGSPDDTVGEREIDRETERVHKKGVITDVQLYSPRADFFVRMPFASPIQKKNVRFFFFEKKFIVLTLAFLLLSKTEKREKFKIWLFKNLQFFFFFFSSFTFAFVSETINSDGWKELRERGSQG